MKQTEEIIKNYIPEKYNPVAEGDIILFEVPHGELEVICSDFAYLKNLSLKTIFAADEREVSGSFKIFYVFGIPKENKFLVPYIIVKNGTFPSMVRIMHQASWYERKIMSLFGLVSEGHPDPRQLILHENWPHGMFPLRKDVAWNTKPGISQGEYQFQEVKGEGVYEIPVGPVHAGVIEPGHFRFSVLGEEIVMLEPRLGYKHRGVEKVFEVVPLEQKVKLSERVSGDSSFNHSLAFCEAVEKLMGLQVPERARYLRVVFGELERIANHLNDIGFIMMDTAFTFGGSQCARIRERVMQWNDRLTDSRYLRGVNMIGGVKKDISKELKNKFFNDLEDIERDFKEVMAASETSSTMVNRLEGTGILDLQVAKDHGIRGVAARALGISEDTRFDYPYAAYKALELEVATEESKDVRARFNVRVKEVYSSLSLIKQALAKAPEGNILEPQKHEMRKNAHAIGMTEGWRGEIVYFVVTDAKGEITRVEMRDPSFLNWTAFPYAVQDNVVPDFPLINKSFNLSYSGNDL